METVLKRWRRWSACRAETTYAGLPDEVRAQARRIDGYLYSVRGWWIWAALLLGVAANAFGLSLLGFPVGWAVGLSGLFFVCMAQALLSAWVRPERFSGRLWHIAMLMVVASYAGAFGSLFGVHRSRPLPQTLDAWLDVLWRATPLQLMAGLGVLLLLWAVGTARRVQLQHALTQLQLQHERDAAARQASEARLRLLQAQIQPHFLFNTLAALQHWVDSGDARAGGLLRAMTAFLRGWWKTPSSTVSSPACAAAVCSCARGARPAPSCSASATTVPVWRSAGAKAWAWPTAASAWRMRTASAPRSR